MLFTTQKTVMPYYMAGSARALSRGRDIKLKKLFFAPRKILTDVELGDIYQ
jgi:hypothetical protein